MSKESSKTRQKLYTYDNKCVRIYLKDGTVVEGSCTHNNCDYNEHEYNRREESLVVHSYIFYKREIESVEEISKEECLSSFGWIEEEILKDEIEWIEYEFDTEDEIDIIRLLLCLDSKEVKEKDKESLLSILKQVIDNNKEERIIELSNKIIKKLQKEVSS